MTETTNINKNDFLFDLFYQFSDDDFEYWLEYDNGTVIEQYKKFFLYLDKLYFGLAKYDDYPDTFIIEIYEINKIKNLGKNCFYFYSENFFIKYYNSDFVRINSGTTKYFTRDIEFIDKYY
jgi:hypothetical protein